MQLTCPPIGSVLLRMCKINHITIAKRKLTSRITCGNVSINKNTYAHTQYIYIYIEAHLAACRHACVLELLPLKSYMATAIAWGVGIAGAAEALHGGGPGE